MATVRLSHQEKVVVSVALERVSTNPARYRCEIDGKQLEIAVSPQPSGGWLHLQDRSVAYHAVRIDQQVWVWIAGETYLFDVVRSVAKRSDAAGGGAAGNDIQAPMPGKILQIHVENGDAVELNQPLIVMESMKMEMTLSASRAGKVEQVLCEEGQLVESNALLIRLGEVDS